MPDADAGPEGWSSRDKFAAVLETAALNESECPSSYKVGHQTGLNNGGSGSFV